MEKLKNELLDIFYKANQNFLIKNENSILHGVSERSLCSLLSHEFADIIKKGKFSKYYSDVEYNRNGTEVKAIINDEFKIINVVCDLIIHSRGELQMDNLLALEMKKSLSKPADKQKDKERLIALTKKPYNNIYDYNSLVELKYVCDYKLGIYYEINIDKKSLILEIYSEGELCSRLEKSFEYFKNYAKTT